MKKYLSMIALAIASVMMFSSCHKEETTYLDPNSPTNGIDIDKMELEVVVDAEISGAMTKAVSMDITYINFKGESGHAVLNKDFSGQDLTFNTSSKTIGKGKKFGLCVKTTIADYNIYKSESAPWNAMYRAIVKINGEEVKTISLGTLNMETKEGMLLFDWGFNWPQRFCSDVNDQFNGEMIYLKVQDNGEVAWGKN